MEVVIKILQFVMSFSLLVFVHELGHFLFAKMFGMRVDKFYLFFNPWFSLVKFKVGETEFGIGWVPFGGYCKIAGMIDESMDTEALAKPAESWEFRAKPSWQRLLVMLGGVLMNVILAVFIYIGMSNHYGETYVANEDIAYGWQFSELGQEIGFRNGDKIISIDGKRYEKADDIHKKMFLADGATVEILRDGKQVTIEMPKEYTGQKLNDPGFMMPGHPFVIDSLIPDGTAVSAGLMPGDSLMAVNGTSMRFFNEYQAMFQKFKGQQAEITFARDSAGIGQIRTLPVSISEDGTIGVYISARQLPVTEISYNFFQAVPAGIKRTGTEIADYTYQLKLLFTPKTEAYKNIGGPIMIGTLFPSTWDWFAFWKITAFLSVILAVMNILPIPALDGGHVILLLYEIITRRKPSDKFLEFAQVLGMLIIFGLMIYVMGNDIYRFFIK